MARMGRRMSQISGIGTHANKCIRAAKQGKYDLIVAYCMKINRVLKTLGENGSEDTQIWRQGTIRHYRALLDLLEKSFYNSNVWGSYQTLVDNLYRG